MEFLLALQFLTRLPITINKPVDGKNLGRSMALFPIVGLMVGGATAALHYILSLVFPLPVSDLISIIFLTIITGNMHLDGLMDTADGFFSGKPLEAVLEIMKDSRVGSHGAAAGCLALLSKFIILGQIPPEFKVSALVLFPILGRWAQVYAASIYPYVRTGPGKSSFTSHVGLREILIASAFSMVTIIIVLGFKGWFLAATTLISTALLGLYISKKIGGITGDTLGALSELIEVLGLLALCFLFVNYF
ncbi:MAG: cobalamin synthase [Desulfitibacter sp. BRH_c19]|nr:MAG: cobalamin synthase [Desulfitibacter sp. BRH_c19]